MIALLALVPTAFVPAAPLPAVAPTAGAPVHAVPFLDPAPTVGPLVFARSGSLSGSSARPDKGDEDAAVIAGLAKRGLHDTVVREARSFLQSRPTHRRAPAVRYSLADSLFELGRVPEALAQYEALDGVTGFEQSVEVDYRIGVCSIETGDADRAIQALGAAVAGAKGDEAARYLLAPASFSRAEALFQAGRYGEAVGSYGVAIEADPDGDTASDARFGVAWSRFKAGESAETVAAVEEFLRRHSGDERSGELSFLAAEAQRTAGAFDAALAWYGRVTEGRYFESALRGAAFAEVERGDAQAAAARFGALLERFPAGQFAAEAALQRGVQLVRAGDHRGALAALGTDVVPKDAQAAYWTAAAHAGLGDHEAALRAARAGLERSPDAALGAQLKVAAGDALYELGRTAEAAREYESSGSAYALHAAAVARLNAGDAGEALRLSETLLAGLAREPGTEYRGEALLTRSEALFRLERYGEAEPALRALLAEASPEGGAPPATALEPSELARCRARLAWCRWYAADHPAALALFTAVSRDSAARPAERLEAGFMSGRAALETGDEGAARARFLGYVEAAPEGPYAAESLLRAGRLTPGPEGLASFDRLIAGFPEHPLAPAALSEAAERRIELGDTPGAIRDYTALVERFPNDPGAPNALYGLGWAQHQVGNSAAAAAPLWQVARSASAPADLRAASAELLVWVEAAAERPGEVTAALAAMLERVDDGPRVLRAARVADAALAKGENAAAAREDLWARVAARVEGPELCAARVEQGFVALDRDDTETAAKLAGLARELGPESADVAELSFFVGEAYFGAGSDERAIALYAAATDHGRPEVVERALYKAGFAELRRGDNAAAAARFGAVVERFPAGVLFPESLYLTGEARFRDGAFEDAAPWLRRMTTEFREHESRPKALFRLGVCEVELGRHEQASVALAELVAKHPGFPNLVEAELWRGRALRNTGQLRGARQSLARVVDNDEGVLAARARIELARVSEAENDAEGAVAEYLKVAVLYGHAEECAEALVRAGDVLARTGKEERARSVWAEARKDYPKTPWGAKAAQRLE
ncbi:MAG: tetratricopeptide repeat protein [Planctomycetota bacterium]